MFALEEITQDESTFPALSPKYIIHLSVLCLRTGHNPNDTQRAKAAPLDRQSPLFNSRNLLYNKDFYTPNNFLIKFPRFSKSFSPVLCAAFSIQQPTLTAGEYYSPGSSAAGSIARNSSAAFGLPQSGEGVSPLLRMTSHPRVLWGRNQDSGGFARHSSTFSGLSQAS